MIFFHDISSLYIVVSLSLFIIQKFLSEIIDETSCTFFLFFFLLCRYDNRVVWIIALYELWTKEPLVIKSSVKAILNYRNSPFASQTSISSSIWLPLLPFVDSKFDRANLVSLSWKVSLYFSIPLCSELQTDLRM